jgi:aspartate/methionine/tyrosine aminotransferase
MKIQKAKRLTGIEEYYFSKKLDQVRQMVSTGIDVVNLGIGSPDLPPSDATIEAASTALLNPKNHGYASYRSLPEFRQAIADWYNSTYGVRLNPLNEILPLLGSKEGILYVSMAFADPGDTILVPNPGYPAYASVARLIGAETRYYDLTSEGDWLPDLDALSRTDLSRCKLMWVNYPHMPSGRRADARLFARLVSFARERGILLCNDNPYSLVLNDERPLSLLSFDPAMECTLELNSFSKSFQMAGWRVGMACASPSVIDSVLQVKSNVDSGMFTPVQMGAIKALSNPASWHDARNAELRGRREIAYKIFEALGFICDPLQVGLFLWAKAPEGVVVEEFFDRVLTEAHVFLVPGSVFGSNGSRYGRLSLCAPTPRLEESLKRVSSWKAGRA